MGGKRDMRRITWQEAKKGKKKGKGRREEKEII